MLFFSSWKSQKRQNAGIACVLLPGCTLQTGLSFDKSKTRTV